MQKCKCTTLIRVHLLVHWPSIWIGIRLRPLTSFWDISISLDMLARYKTSSSPTSHQVCSTSWNCKCQPAIICNCLKGTNLTLIASTLQVVLDLAEIYPHWMSEYPYVVDALLDVWCAETPPAEDDASSISAAVKWHLLINIFKGILRQKPWVDILFDLNTGYTWSLPIDLVHRTRFLLNCVAFSNDVFYQWNVLFCFLTWLSDRSQSWSDKTHFICIFITPMLLYWARTASKNALG